MQLTFLGTASCYPTTTRGVSCTALRFEDGDVWLFDCGEGSQVQLQKSSIHPKRISKIFITHLHGDHLFGLPGLMCTLGSQVQERKDFVLEINGPIGIRRYIRESLNLSRSPLSYRFTVNELVGSEKDAARKFEGIDVLEESTGPLHPQEILGKQIYPLDEVWTVSEGKNVIVKAAELCHRIISFGFVIREFSSPGQLNVKALQERGVLPGPAYGKLKSGLSISLENGDIITPEEFLGPEKHGRLITILGDTCDSRNILEIARGSDVLVHEATLEDSMKSKALETGHSTPSMAVDFAVSAQAKTLILFHFSQRYKPEGSVLKKDDLSVGSLLEEAKEALKKHNVHCEVYVAHDFLEYAVTRSKE